MMMLLLTLSLSPLYGINGYAALLEKYVDRRGGVHYAALIRDPLVELVYRRFQIALQRPEKGMKHKALLLNSYNFFVLYRVRKFYPLQRVTSVKDFFTARFIPYRGQKISLNHLEKRILFRLYPDPLLHFALTCAAKSCPPLRRQPYSGSGLQSQLARRARSFLRSKEGTCQRGLLLSVSRLFLWYKKDFGGNDRGIRRFLRQYSGIPQKRLSLYRIDFLDYNWSLNNR